MYLVRLPTEQPEQLPLPDAQRPVVAIADAAGGRSQLTSITAAVAVALVLLFAAPILESFPLAALAGLVVYAAARSIDRRRDAQDRRIPTN